jgi:hypothetical protein
MKSSNPHFQLSEQALPTRQIKFPLSSALKSAFERCVQFFANANEPQIWAKTDRYGNTYWHTYDPVSGRSVSLDSEAEMRAWLEQRYYQ